MRYLLCVALIATLVFYVGCSRTFDAADHPDSGDADACVGCHTDKAAIIANAEPDEEPDGEGSGEG